MPPTLQEPLATFAGTVAAKMAQLTAGAPEDQLRAPFETFMAASGSAFGLEVVCTGETPLPDRLGRPDYAVHRKQLLAGYVELKAPGVGVNASRFKGHNRDQFKRFSAVPNILYTDGNEWAIYRDGKLVNRIVRLAGDVATDGDDAVTSQDAHAVEALLRHFLSWQPVIPQDRTGKIDLKAFAAMLAPLCRLLRDDVTEALQHPESPLVQLARDWRQLLFPSASDEQFADAYAQTVTFALLLGRSESESDRFTLESAGAALTAQHNLLSRALQVLTDPSARANIAASLDLLLRVIAEVPPATLTASNEDPWLYFYEDFLAAYDPKLRKDAGVYYTPVEVVRTQVRLVDDLLVNRLGKSLGFADSGVITLDPAVGTGTYLLGVIEHTLARIHAKQGCGAIEGQATTLARNLYGFELMVGPYSVAELRVSRTLHDRGAELPADGTQIYLTDTLENPHAKAPELPQFLRPISDEHAKALQVKKAVPVIVCLGNPPYDRHEAATAANKARTGGWVRWGSEGEEAIFEDFRNPVIADKRGGQLKNLYNQYLYFWRWALWKVFEQDTTTGPGVISFISASSYLDGDAFGGVRERLRQQCDEVWILDLGGEQRGPRKTENVFAIQTPVAIAVAMRTGEAKPNSPATVRYTRIDGTRREKLAALDAIRGISTVGWQECPTDWKAPLRPEGRGLYFDWPLLTDLMPWQQSGVKAGRTWVISSEQETLHERWRTLLRADMENRATLFKNSPTGRKVDASATELPPATAKSPAVAGLSPDTPPPGVARFAFRSLDRQYIFQDARLLDRPGPPLWRAHGQQQVYLTSLLTTSPLGAGAAITACAAIPDLHHFRGSAGAKDAIPLYRKADASEANVLTGLLDKLGEAYQRMMTPEDFLAYTYGLLAHPAFTTRFAEELGTKELRLPITQDVALFEQARATGTRLLWLHTYGERFVPKGEPRGSVPSGLARCTQAVPGDTDGYPDTSFYNRASATLHVGAGVFSPVAPDIYDFEVSGLKVVQSWLNYRMKSGAGRKSSPLDDIRPTQWTSAFTTELLELLWVLEATVALYPEQERLLEAVVEGPCFQVDDLPPVPDDLRKPPRARVVGDDLLRSQG